MKKSIVGIFAHPDDETFGPGGTLAKLAKENNVYIICITAGDGKQQTRAKERALGKIRKKELLASTKILGVKKVFFLGYRDGSLQHNLYHEIAEKLMQLLKELKPDTLITFEPRGVSGHVDHIVTSMIVSFIFPKVKSANKLMYYCNSLKRSLLMAKGYFIYFPPGYTSEEIGEVVDVRGVWKQKLQAMYQHKSQMHDVRRILARTKDFPQEEAFLVIEK